MVVLLQEGGTRLTAESFIWCLNYFGIFDPFETLQRPCAGLTFSSVSDPPLDRGIKWSICNPFSHPKPLPTVFGAFKSIGLLQMWQFNPYKDNTSFTE